MNKIFPGIKFGATDIMSNAGLTAVCYRGTACVRVYQTFHTPHLLDSHDPV